MRRTSGTASSSFVANGALCVSARLPLGSCPHIGENQDSPQNETLDMEETTITWTWTPIKPDDEVAGPTAITQSLLDPQAGRGNIVRGAT